MLLVLCLCFICRTYKSIMMEIEEMEASSTSSKQNSRRKKERERIRAKRAKMTPEEKDKARADNTKKERERIRAKRAKIQQYLDSMALFQFFGRPHLFITITANPEWAEIQENLMPGQTALDRDGSY